ncbi:MAG: 50S ribosomal protein L17 [Candidatus Paceibacterota bacterium]
MKHHAKQKKLGRVKNQREALLASLTEALVEHGQIKTTEAKAKALRPFVEKLITRAAEDNQQTRRLIIKRLKGRKDTAAKLIEEIAPRYIERPGGYTRIVKLPPRRSDGASEAIIQFVEEEKIDA